MLTVLLAVAFSFSSMAAGSLLVGNNQNATTSSSAHPFDKPSPKSSMWGSSESTLFNNSNTPAKAGTRMNAPAMPDEPGATCVPVPVGTMVLLGMAFIYGLVVL
jgi:hypothetical protein